MSKNVKTVFIWFLLFCLFSVAGAALGFGIAYLDRQGAFYTWRQLPNTLKFERIAEADLNTVWAQTPDGSVFSCEQPSTCQQWVRVDKVPALPQTMGAPPLERQKTCANERFPLRQEPPGRTVECVITGYTRPDFGERVYFALLADGTIWVQDIGISTFEAVLMPTFFGGVGLAVGLLAFVLYASVSRLQKMKRER